LFWSAGDVGAITDVGKPVEAKVPVRDSRIGNDLMSFQNRARERIEFSAKYHSVARSSALARVGFRYGFWLLIAKLKESTVPPGLRLFSAGRAITCAAAARTTSASVSQRAAFADGNKSRYGSRSIVTYTPEL